MKQKIVIKVSTACSKCRTNALKIAAVTEGVVSVALDGPDKDKLTITGDGIDVACLTCSLRKKICHASIETVEEVKDKKPEEKKKEEKKECPKPPIACCPKPPCEPPIACCPKPPCEPPIACCPKPPICPYPQPEFFVVSDPYPSSCNIL